MAFLKPESERTPEENKRIKETLNLISEMPLITDKPNDNKLPKSVCKFIALVSEYREAEKEYRAARIAGRTKPQGLSARLEMITKTGKLGEQLDAALADILPLKDAADGD